MSARLRHELWAESIRDVAPLDTLLRNARGSWVDWLIALGIAILGLLAIALGVKLEADT
jgi:hypothetical protein